MHAIQTRFWVVRDYFAPVLRESKFVERGRITPGEFVTAGDYLTRSFPAWTWCTGDRKHTRDFLPKDKQYLACRGVPCFKRVSQVVPRKLLMLKPRPSSVTGNSFLGSPRSVQIDNPDPLVKEGSDEWVMPEVDYGGAQFNAADLSTYLGRVSRARDTEHDPEDDLGDFSEMQERFDAAQVALTSPARSISPTPSMQATPGRMHTHARRTYDCIITYDKYYQTPRMWLVGYDYSGIPLSPTQVFEDIASDHAHSTVTMEPFPHGVPLAEYSEFPDIPELSTYVASIHPCKHASVMHKLIDRINEASCERRGLSEEDRWQQTTIFGRVFGWSQRAPMSGVDIEQYLIVFLKLIASIVPTIEIDATQAV